MLRLHYRFLSAPVCSYTDMAAACREDLIRNDYLPADNAKRGDKEINDRAMKMLPRGGYLATCSCSHFMPNELFRKMLLEAAKDAGVSLRLIEERRAAPDHPVAMAIPETDYLKFYLLQIV